MSLQLANTIKRLETYNSSEFPILTVYLTFPDPKKVRNETIINYLQTLLEHHISLPIRKSLKQNIEYIEGFLVDYQQAHDEKTIAFFTGDNKLFEVLHLPFLVENKVVVDHSPFLLPLLQVLNQYRRYLVVLADREKAKFFTLYNGNLEDQGEVFDQTVPQEVKGRVPEAQYANRQDKIQRHIQDHLHRHFQTISQEVFQFVKNKPISGVIIGGHKQFMHQFEKCLPKGLQEKIVGEFVSELNVSVNEMMERSKKVVDNVNKSMSHQQISYLGTG